MENKQKNQTKVQTAIKKKKKKRARWTYLRSQSCKCKGMCFTSSNLDNTSGKRHGARVKNISIKGGAKISHGLKHESTYRIVAIETGL